MFTALSSFHLSSMLVRATRGMACLLLLLAIPLTASAAAVTDSGTENGVGLNEFSLTNSSVAGGSMLKGVGDTANQIANILTGPVLWIVMGAAVILAIYGFATGKMATAFTGIGAFVLAAVLKGLFSIIRG